jgi:hypothetical protein
LTLDLHRGHDLPVVAGVEGLQVQRYALSGNLAIFPIPTVFRPRIPSSSPNHESGTLLCRWAENTHAPVERGNVESLQWSAGRLDENCYALVQDLAFRCVLVNSICHSICFLCAPTLMSLPPGNLCVHRASRSRDQPALPPSGRHSPGIHLAPYSSPPKEI